MFSKCSLHFTMLRKSIPYISGFAVMHFYRYKFDRTVCHFESEYNTNAKAIAEAIDSKKDPYDVVDEDEELEWDIKKDNCPFCRTFLDSPCRVNFQRWSKCVDQAKQHGEDYIGLCKAYTEKLVSCTNSHTQYFESLHRKQNQNKDEHDNGEDNDTADGEEIEDNDEIQSS